MCVKSANKKKHKPQEQRLMYPLRAEVKKQHTHIPKHKRSTSVHTKPHPSATIHLHFKPHAHQTPLTSCCSREHYVINAEVKSIRFSVAESLRSTRHHSLPHVIFLNKK